MKVMFSLAAPTYLGLIDDVVGRHPWPGTGPTLPLDAILLQYLLFGGTLIINDGYLAANDACQQALSQPDSLLNLLGARGILRIASTRMPASASIVARAEGGVAGHRQLIARADWPEIAIRIDRLGQEFSPTDIGIPWPRRDLSRNFAAMTERLLDSQLTEEVLTANEKAFVAHFLTRLAARPEAPRTQWEELVVAVAGSPEFHAGLLQLANQIYHLNFAAALGCEIKKSISVASWADGRTMPLLGRRNTSVERIELDAPKLRCDVLAAGALARRLLEDRDFLNLRAAFLDNWQNSDTRTAYADLLSNFHGDGDDLIAPPSSLAFDDPERAPRFVIWRISGSPVGKKCCPSGIMRIFMSERTACIASADPSPFLV